MALATAVARAAALSTTVALVVAACLTDAPPPTGAPTVTPEPEATPTVTRYPIDTTVWYAGLVLTFGTATATLDAKGGPVAVDMSLQNAGDAETTVAGPIRLAFAEVVVEPTRESVLPTVPAAGSATTTVTFEVDGEFDPASAAIRVGRDSEHQAIVPLVAGPATPPITLQPFEFEVSAEAQTGPLFVELLGVELRADLPDWDLELPREMLALTLTYHATFRSDFPGGAAFTTENVGLTLPDGETITPRRDGHSHSIALLRPGRRNTISTRFEVPDPANGHYGFIVRDGSTSSVIPFDVTLP